MQRDVGTGHVGARAAPLHFISTSGRLSSSRWWSPRSSGRGRLPCGSLDAHGSDPRVRHFCMVSTDPGIPQHVPIQLRTPLSFPLQDSSGCLGLAGRFLQPPDLLSLPSGGCQDKRGQARLPGQHGGLGRPQELPGQVGCLHTFLPAPAPCCSLLTMGIWDLGCGSTPKEKRGAASRSQCEDAGTGRGGRGAGCGDQAVRGSHKQLKKKNPEYFRKVFSLLFLLPSP